MKDGSLSSTMMGIGARRVPLAARRARRHGPAGHRPRQALRAVQGPEANPRARVKAVKLLSAFQARRPH